MWGDHICGKPQYLRTIALLKIAQVDHFAAVRVNYREHQASISRVTQ